MRAEIDFTECQLPSLRCQTEILRGGGVMVEYFWYSGVIIAAESRLSQNSWFEGIMTRGHGPSIMVYIGPDSYDVILRFFLADFPTELNQTMAKSFGTRARALSTFILSQLPHYRRPVFSSPFEIDVLRGLNGAFFSTVERDEGH